MARAWRRVAKETVARREDECLRNRCQSAVPNRRGWDGEALSLAACDDPVWPSAPASAADAVSVGLNPLFLDSDIQLLSMLEAYLVARLGRPVQLVKRRTYQEITAMLLSGQLDAAWVCDDPYVQHEDQFALLAVPLYQHEPLYQTYVIVSEASKAQSFDDVRGSVHAFSDPGQHFRLFGDATPPCASSNHPRTIFPHLLFHLWTSERRARGRVRARRERQHGRLRLGRHAGSRAGTHQWDPGRLQV